MAHSFIDLGRRFVPISPVGEEEPGAAFDLSETASSSASRWDALLENDASVVLGTAGSGKSAELRSQVSRLHDAGKPAFLVRLETLHRKPLSGSLDHRFPSALAELRAWSASKREGFIFLDALDEARLPSGGAMSVFDDALTNLFEGLGNAAGRTKIVISCRGSEWFDEVDRDRLINRLRAWRSTADDPKVQVYRMLPLAMDQVAELVRSRGIDAEVFTRAVRDARSATLVTTPLDVHFLADLWLAEVADGNPPATVFGSRLTIFRRVTGFRLARGPEEHVRSHLDPMSAVRAIYRLAAAATLTGILDIVPYGEVDGALDAQRVLSAPNDPWSLQNIRQLLSYSVFDPEVGGRIRFAHRELQDYLAAQFFANAIKERAGSLKPISPLIARFGDKTYLPSELTNFFGWLATLEPRLRPLVTEKNPALLVEAGDPEALGLEDREAALAAHVALYDNREYRGEYLAASDLARFASSGLGPSVRRLLRSTRSKEAREHLIKLASVGRMMEVIDECIRIATDPDDDLRVRSEAIDALLELSPTATLVTVAQELVDEVTFADGALMDGLGWNDFLLSVCHLKRRCGASVSLLSELLGSLTREATNHSTATSDQIRNLVEQGDADIWLRHLVPLAMGQGHDEMDMPTIDDRCRLVLPAVGALLLRSDPREDGNVQARIRLDALELLCAVSYRQGILHFKPSLSDTAQAIAARSDLKVALINRRANPSGSSPVGVWRAIHNIGIADDKYAILTLRDVELLANNAERSADRALRKRLFEMAWQVVSELPKLVDRKGGLRLLRGVAARTRDRDLKAQVHTNPWKRFQWWCRRTFEMWKWEQRIRRLRHFVGNQVVKLNNSYSFLRNRGLLRNGRAFGLFRWVAQQRAKGGERSLDEFFGPEFKRYGWWGARDFQLGLSRLWKQPELDDFSQHGSAIILAAAVGLELDLPSRVESASASEVRRAFALLVHNADGFPSWTWRLAELHPAELSSTVLPMLRQAMQNFEDAGSSPLSLVAYSDGPFCRLLGPGVVQLLLVEQVLNLRSLELALSIPRRGDADLSGLQQTAVSRFRLSAYTSDFDRAWIWLEILFEIDASVGWAELIAQIDLGWTRRPDSVLLGFLARVGEGTRYQRAEPQPNSLDNNARVLANLIELALDVAPPDLDVDHEDVYSPGQRDHAASARRHLVGRLIASGTPVAAAEFERLANLSAFARYRDWMLSSRDNLIAAAAKRTKVSNAEVVDVLDGSASQPTTAERFGSYVEVITEAILDRFANGDHNEAQPFRRLAASDPTDRDEGDFRNWLSGRLDEAGANVFTTTREAELAAANRTDIRLTGRARELGNVTIEVKLADRSWWSGATLLSTLQTQLLDQYMRTHEAHTGILVLVNCRGAGLFKIIDGKRRTFEEIVKLLTEQATNLSGTKSLRVLAIAL